MFNEDNALPAQRDQQADERVSERCCPRERLLLLPGRLMIAVGVIYFLLSTNNYNLCMSALPSFCFPSDTSCNTRRVVGEINCNSQKKQDFSTAGVILFMGIFAWAAAKRRIRNAVNDEQEPLLPQDENQSSPSI